MKSRIFFTRLVLGVLVLVVVLPALGCSSTSSVNETEAPQPIEEEEQAAEVEHISFESEVQSEKGRLDASDVAIEDVDKLVEGNTAFALDLYQAVRHQGGNLFYSPYSISLALAMTYAGAKGETAEQMANTLHYLLPQEKLHPAFNALDQSLANLGADIPADFGDAFQLSIANAIWGQRDYAFLPEFLDTLAVNYGAGMRIVDFMTDPDGSREIINQWVSDQTERKIQDILPAGSITPATRLVLGNAIYFNASWAETFSEDLTEDGTFYTFSGEEVTVPLMQYNASKQLSYIKGNNYQAVELPYLGNQVSMLVIVPNAGKFAEFEEEFSTKQLEAIRNGLQFQSVSLTFPKFEFEAPLNLTQTLAEMGMPLPVSPGADFSGMTGNLDLYISDIFHKAYVSVDEMGTEAAAATLVAMEATGMPLEGVELVVDRPFLFLIQDMKTGTIFFLGQILNPMQ